MEYFIEVLLPIITSFSVTVLLIVILSPMASRIGLLDVPSERKTHGALIPLVGGIAIFVSIFFALLLVPFPLSGYRILFFCMGITLIVGVLDDYNEISSSARIFAQFLIAIVLVYMDELVVTGTGDAFLTGDEVRFGRYSELFTIIAIIGVINSFNMLDGHDGLCGLGALTIFVSLALLCRWDGEWEYQRIMLIYGAAIAGFLLFNLPVFLGKHRQVFMGDSGSMLLGLIIVYSLIHLSQNENPIIKTVSAPWLVALPLLDMFTVIFFRISSGHSPFRPDRRHIHHLLVDLGVSKYRTLILLLAIHGVFIFVAIWSSRSESIQDWVLFWGMFPILALYMLVTSRFNAKVQEKQKSA